MYRFQHNTPAGGRVLKDRGCAVQKRAFLLMEVLIAFSLILVCIIPLVKQPLEWMRAEYQKCAQLEQ
ncbi:MAG: hypothetical protein KGI83_05375, partial [Verrucomicrobiota bacterium]|nr:hypothetical protein [Verrucomicrobiota bacterium]